MLKVNTETLKVLTIIYTSEKNIMMELKRNFDTFPIVDFPKRQI